MIEFAYSYLQNARPFQKLLGVARVGIYLVSIHLQVLGKSVRTVEPVLPILEGGREREEWHGEVWS